MATYTYSKQVEDQQKELNKLGANLKVDGLLGPLTQAAMTKYSPASTTALTPGQFGAPTSPKIPIATSPTTASEVTARIPKPTVATPSFSSDQPTYIVKAGDKFNPYNGQPLNNAPVGTTIQNPFGTNTTTKVSDEDKGLLDMGVTPEQITKLNTPEGMDPGEFQSLIGNIENKLKTNNDLVTQRGYLIKHLYDDKLTKDELKALPEDIQQIIKSGDQDTIQLQIRLLNDQIAGRANTLSQSIGYLVQGYQTSVEQAEKQKDNAINTVLDFVGAYGSKAPQVLGSLYGQQYLDKLKGMGIDIAAMASVSTLAQQREARLSSNDDGGGKGTDLFTKTQLNKGASNSALSLDEFKALPYEVKNFFVNASATNISELQDAIASVKDGSVSAEEAKSEIDSLAISEEVKNHIKKLIDEATPESTTAEPPSKVKWYNPFTWF